MICHRRWQTMLNRGWSVSVTCGSRMLHICSASKMSNIIVPLRGTYYSGCTFRRLRSQRGLPAVKHGSAPSVLTRLFVRTEYQQSESATAPRLCLLGCLWLSPRRRLRFAYRQHGVIEVQPLRGCASGGIAYARYHRAAFIMPLRVRSDITAERLQLQ